MASTNGTVKGEPTTTLIQWLRDNGAIINKVFPKTVPGIPRPFTLTDRKGLEEGYLQRPRYRQGRLLFVSRAIVF